MAVDPARSGELIARGLEIMAAINRAERARAPGGRADLRLPARRLLRGRAGRRRATRPRSSPAGWTARRAARAPRRGWPRCTPAGSWRSARTFVNESVIGTRFTGRLVEETTVGGLPAVVPEITGRAWVTGHGPVPARRRAIRSRPASRCERAAPTSSCVGAGIVGACAALELARGGASVEVLERGGGWGEGCSWGNAGLLVPSHARPIAAPESLRAGLGWMVRPDSPFGLKLKPSLAPWLARYLRASTARRADDGEALQRELCRESLGAVPGAGGRGHRRRLRRAGLPDRAHRRPTRSEHAAAEAGLRDGPRARRAGADRRRGARAGAGADRPRPRGGAVPGRGALRPGAAGGGGRRRRGGPRGAAAHGRRGLRACAPDGVETTHGPLRAGHGRGRRGRLVGPARAQRRRAAPAAGRQGLRRRVGPGGRAGCGCRCTCTTSACVANPMGDRTRMTGGLLLDGLDESFDAPPRARDRRGGRGGARRARAAAADLARPAPVHARRAAGDRRDRRAASCSPPATGCSASRSRR